MYLLDNILKKSFVFNVLFVLFYTFIQTNYILIIVVTTAAFLFTDTIFNLIWYFVPKRMLPDLQDKAVFVTGCDTGFGHDFAKKLDSLGVRVFAGCLFSEGDGAKDLKSSCSDNLKIIQLDVTKDDQVENAVKEVTSILQEKGQELWAVVNNAGIVINGEIEWTPIEVYQKTFDVNTLGPVRITKAFLPLLKRSKGRVVNVVSAAGYISVPYITSYCMSKHATMSFSNGLRQELLKWSISVHTIEPWAYRTEIFDEDKLKSNFEENFNNASKKVQEGYDEEYLEKAKWLITFVGYFASPRTAIYEVTDTLTHATVGKNPKVRYTPGLFGLLITTVISIASIELMNIISYIICPKVDNSKLKSKKLQ